MKVRALTLGPQGVAVLERVTRLMRVESYHTLAAAAARHATRVPMRSSFPTLRGRATRWQPFVAVCGTTRARCAVSARRRRGGPHIFRRSGTSPRTTSVAPSAARADRGADRARPVQGALAVARGLSRTRVVSRRQVRHLHPLGRVLGAGIRQRVVLAQHVRRRAARPTNTRSPPMARSRSSATRTSSPCSHGGALRPRRMGRSLRARRRPLRGAGRRALATASPCTTRSSRSGTRQDGAQARRSRRLWEGGTRPWAAISASPRTAPSTGGGTTAARSSTPM